MRLSKLAEWGHWAWMTIMAGSLMSGAAIAQTQSQIRDQNYAICNSANRNPDIVIEACTRLLENESQALARRLAIALVIRGSALQRKGELQNAAADFSRAIAIDPSLAAAYEARGALLRADNQCNFAIADFDHLITLQPKRLDTYVARGFCFLATSEADRAKADFDHVIEADPNNKGGQTVLAWSGKAQIDSQRGAFDQAIANYDEVIRVRPALAAAYVDRAGALEKAGKIDAALIDLGKAITLDPNNVTGNGVAALSARAELHQKQGRIEQAIADYDAAIALAPNRIPLLFARAAAWTLKGEADRALADYDAAIKLDPNALAYNARGDFFRGRGEYDKAIADYDAASEKQPDDLTGYGNRALTRFYQGNFSKAAADFRKVVDTQPNPYSLLWLYLSRARAGDTFEARDQMAKASKEMTNDWPTPVVQLFLGKKDALERLRTVAATPEQKCEAQFYIGEWQLLQKERTEAAKALQLAIETCPKDFAEYGGASEELKRLKAASH